MRTVNELKKVLGIPLSKEKTYVDSPDDAPEGADVKQGPKGGYYYESDSGIEGHTTYQDDVNKLKVLTDTKLLEYGKEQEKKLFTDIRGWFLNVKTDEFDANITNLFKLDKEGSRYKDPDLYYSPFESHDKDTYYKLYAANQEHLKRKYPDGKVTLYRGVDGKTKEKFNGMSVGAIVPLDCYNVSSWSTDKNVGEMFANQSVRGGVLVKIEVPIKRILHTHEMSGLAYDEEKEYLLMGSKVEGSIEKIVPSKMTGE